MYKAGKRSGGKGGKGGGRDDAYRSEMIEQADMHNERFDKYYKAQNILEDDEWSQFMDSLRAPLPTTFRVAGSRQ